MKDQALSNVFLFKLEIANKQFRKYKNRIFKQKGIDLTSDQWILLKNIIEADGINQAELGKKSKKEAAAVTRTLDIMERKGWIVRMPDPHSRRVYNLSATKEGEKLAKKVLPIALEVRKQASRGLTKKDINQLNLMLDKIYNNLE